MLLDSKKFKDPLVTAKGEKRASVKLNQLETLWFNTGTVCNLSCENCYIESTPTNDRLSFISYNEVKSYLVEIKELNLGTKEIAFTGGEPFINPEIISILQLCLEEGYETLVLTNAYHVINRHKVKLMDLQNRYGDKLCLRVSLDHYSKDVHEKERGENTFDQTVENIKWLNDNKFNIAIAGRSLIEESSEEALLGFQKLFNDKEITINYSSPKHFMVFPEMDTKVDVPEITVDCWGILNKSPNEIMCSNSRMIVKRKGQQTPKILACTLLAYDEQFEMGESFRDVKDSVQLNHPHCAKFCVLGGASCSV
ncbi:radical SAM protein [Bacteriovoracaceae bacterium]|nr:radical SAM protein [Bacteriovoracaceae bacterium]